MFQIRSFASSLLCALPLVVALSSSACSKGPEPKASEQRAAAPAAAAPTSQAATPADPTEARRDAMRTLSGQLAYEAGARRGGQRVEDAFAALERAGLALDGTRQYLAKVAAAEYCAGGMTRSGVSVSACEYASAEEARAGVARVAARFPHLVAGREVLFVGRLSVALSVGGQRPDAATLERARTALEREPLAAR